MHRLFVAIRPPAAIMAALQSLMHGVEGARWQDASQLHITLRFIGEVDARQAEDIAAALGRLSFAPFKTACAGLGRFDHRGHVNALWAGLSPREPLAHLHRKIDRLCVDAGMPPERRAYLPHITLARLGAGSRPTDMFVTRHGGLATPAFLVDQVLLFESILGPDGATYHVVGRYLADRVRMR
ncbi:RNA 2',3'-cyclic phosphodiesterase [Sphingobium sp. AN641]|uniref:RNA 2',3'-cyclic phosphodiesterase n=1 Tax=Sphingobium sp. AN641 TaxID=3133443 RepID=UPI0030BD723B